MASWHSRRFGILLPVSADPLLTRYLVISILGPSVAPRNGGECCTVLCAGRPAQATVIGARWCRRERENRRKQDLLRTCVRLQQTTSWDHPAQIQKISIPSSMQPLFHFGESRDGLAQAYARWAAVLRIYGLLCSLIRRSGVRKGEASCAVSNSLLHHRLFFDAR